MAYSAAQSVCRHLPVLAWDNALDDTHYRRVALREIETMKILINATFNNESMWAAPNSLATRAYGIARCLTRDGNVYTAIKWS